MTKMIGRRVFTRLVAIGAMLALPVMGHAQEATLSGTITDSTGGVLPGVTVTALHETTGNTFVAVTDQRGAFRLPVRTGGIRITVELVDVLPRTANGKVRAVICKVPADVRAEALRQHRPQHQLSR